MKDENKSKKQLIVELDKLRQRHTQLETDREGVAEALRESEASMKGILKAAPIGIGLVHNRVLGWVSDHMHEMLGYSGEELIGKSARVLYENDEEFERVGREKYQEIRERGVGAIETRWKRKDGRLIDVHLRSTPVDPTDLGQGVLFTALDVSESKYAQRALSESEKRYRRITEAITDYIFTVKVVEGHPAETHHGPTCEAVTGYTTEEFNADPFLWIRMVPAEDQDVVRAQAWEVLSGGDPGPIEHRIIRKDGQIRWVSNSLVPTSDGQGNLVSYDGLLRDITNRKIAEETLRESEERYRHLVETMNEGLATADQNYVFTFVNETLCEMLGYSREEMLGRYIVEFVHEDYKDFMEEQIARRQRGEASSYELDWRAKDGQRVYTLGAFTMQMDSSRAVWGSSQTSPTASGRKRRCKELTPNWSCGCKSVLPNCCRQTSSLSER